MNQLWHRLGKCSTTAPHPSPLHRCLNTLSPNFTSRIYTNNKRSEFRGIFSFSFPYSRLLSKSSKYIEKGKMNTFHSRKITKSNVNSFPVVVGPLTGRANWPSANLHLSSKDLTEMLCPDTRPVDIGDHLCFCCCYFGSVAAYQTQCCRVGNTHILTVALCGLTPFPSTAAAVHRLLPWLPISLSIENSFEAWGHYQLLLERLPAPHLTAAEPD